MVLYRTKKILLGMVSYEKFDIVLNLSVVRCNTVQKFLTRWGFDRPKIHLNHKQYSHKIIYNTLFSNFQIL